MILEREKLRHGDSEVSIRLYFIPILLTLIKLYVQQKGKGIYASIESVLSKLEEGNTSYFQAKKISQRLSKKEDYEGLDSKVINELILKYF